MISLPKALKPKILNYHDHMSIFLYISDFIIRLDQTCGPLTLHSSLKELVRYTQEGLDFLSKEIKDDEMQ